MLNKTAWATVSMQSNSSQSVSCRVHRVRSRILFSAHGHFLAGIGFGPLVPVNGNLNATAYRHSIQFPTFWKHMSVMLRYIVYFMVLLLNSSRIPSFIMILGRIVHVLTEPMVVFLRFF